MFIELDDIIVKFEIRDKELSLKDIKEIDIRVRNYDGGAEVTYDVATGGVFIAITISPGLLHLEDFRSQVQTELDEIIKAIKTVSDREITTWLP